MLSATGMASDSERESDREDSVFTDGLSGNDGASGSRKRQMSVPEIVRQVEQKRARRQLPQKKHRSPRERQQRNAPSEAASAPRSEVTLPAIQQLIEAGNSRVIKALEARFAQQERRIEILEAECFDKDATIRQLNQEVRSQRQEVDALKDKIDGIDMNRRLSSLILTCEEFGQRSSGENIEVMTVRVLNKRFPDVNLTTADIQAAHRLPGNGKVIAMFVRRGVRDELFERRFELARRPESGRRGSPSDRRMAALYLNESLVPEHQRMYTELLAARKPENGAKVASVFTRRGYVYCRMERGGENIRVRDRLHLQRILHGGPCSPTAEAPGGAGSARGGPPIPPGAGRVLRPAGGDAGRPSSMVPRVAGGAEGGSAAPMAGSAGGGPPGPPLAGRDFHLAGDGGSRLSSAAPLMSGGAVSDSGPSGAVAGPSALCPDTHVSEAVSVSHMPDAGALSERGLGGAEAASGLAGGSAAGSGSVPVRRSPSTPAAVSGSLITVGPGSDPLSMT